MEDWQKERLEKIAKHEIGVKGNPESAQEWLRDEVKPAFKDLAEELWKYAWEQSARSLASVETTGIDGLSPTLRITYTKGKFEYTIQVSSFAGDIKARRIFKDDRSDTKNCKKLAILDWTKDAIINDFIEEYENWIRWKT